MKKLLLYCATALGLITTPAFADYFCPPPPCGPCDPCGPCGPCEPICCGTEWNGFYVGGDVGVFTNTIFFNDFDHFTMAGSIRHVNTKFTAGVLVGYDMECANKLIGIVADWNWVNNSRRHHSSSDASFCRHRNNWFTTIRARAGVTLCDALFYITLGAAVHKLNVDFVGTVEPLGTLLAPASIRINKTIWGWAGGAGVEYALGCGWSVAAEVLSINFSHHSRKGLFTAFPATPTLFRVSVSDIGYLGRVILNYRFGDLLGF